MIEETYPGGLRSHNNGKSGPKMTITDNQASVTQALARADFKTFGSGDPG